MRKGEGGGRKAAYNTSVKALAIRTVVSYVCYSSVSILLSTNPCDMYKSSLRYIHDPVLLSQDRNNIFFTLKCSYMFRLTNHHQGAYCRALLKLWLLK